MEEELKKQLLKNPLYKIFIENALILPIEELEEIKKSKTISIRYEEVPTLLLKKILEEDSYFEYCYNYFQDKTTNFIISSIKENQLTDPLKFNKSTLVKAMNQWIEENNIKKEELLQRYNTLCKTISYEKLKEKEKNSNYSISVDNIHYTIPIIELLSFLEQSNILDICKNMEIKEISNIPKEHFIYIVIQYIRNSNILNNYILPKTIIDHYHELLSFQLIDFQSLNKFLTTSDPYYKNIQLNEDLKEEIIKDLPKDFNNLEKAIYIYIKLCKTLTYDEEYFVKNNESGVINHQDINHISNITPSNNKIVCFEFNLIYSKFLDELGIHFSSDYQKQYGIGHSNLEFRVDKFLVIADSVTTILQGDLARSKLNVDLVGLKCENINSKTKEEFQDTLKYVYNYIKEEEKKKESIKNSSLEELIQEYKKTIEKKEDITFIERLSILFDLLKKNSLVGIDYIAYVIQLKKILFTDLQRKENIRINIIRNNEEKQTKATLIISLNKISFEDYPENNIHYISNDNHELSIISKEELQKKFDEEHYEYIQDINPRIPNIIESRDKVR